MASKNRAKLAQVFDDAADLGADSDSTSLAENTAEEQEENTSEKKSKTKPGYRQTTMILKNEHISWLVGKVAEASVRGVVTNKTVIIEILIDLAKEAGVSLAEMDPTKDVEKQIRKRFIEKLSKLA